ncbi:MAG: hypothetical protein ACM33T_11090 [Solirubrobacterales bacterium]
MRARHQFPVAVWPLAVLACLAFGALALILGQDASAGLRSRVFYNGWAFLHGYTNRDVLVAQAGGFANPTLDAAYVFLAEHLPARWLGFLLGVVQALNFPLLFAVAWRLLVVRNPFRRTLGAAVLALAGLLGACSLSEVGTAYLDAVVSLGILSAAVVVVANWDALSDGDPGSAAVLALVAGLPAGFAFGLRGSLVVYALGLALAFLVTNMAPMRRLWLVLWFKLGALGGFAVSGLHWLTHLAGTYQNPVFPSLNHIFRSPWALPLPYGDAAAVPGSVAGLLALGLKIPLDPGLSADIWFRDYRLATVLALLPLAALATIRRRHADPGLVTRSGPTGWLLAATFISYTAWVFLFRTWQTLLPLEMLAPTIVVAAVGTLPLPRAARPGIGAGLVAFLVATTATSGWTRVPWTERAVSASIPTVEEPDHTLVLVSGREPVSFLVPLFPAPLRFVRVDAALAPVDGPETGLARQVREAITGHDGPIRSLHPSGEEDGAEKAASALGLTLVTTGCQTIGAAIGNGTYALCRVERAPRAAEPAVPTATEAGAPAAGG